MNIIVFDVDETLGAFSEFSKYCAKSNKYVTYRQFKYLLDINPIYLQPNILMILEYIKYRKTKNCKVVMFTNNQEHPIWIQYIKLYLHEKLKFELFDKNLLKCI
jgi:FMN phosphatase YigB (HAD superfamily)